MLIDGRFSAAYIGSTPLAAIYAGSKKVWGKPLVRPYWVTGKLYTEGNGDAGGYYHVIYGKIANYGAMSYPALTTLSGFNVYILSVPPRAIAVTITTGNSTYSLGSENRQSICTIAEPFDALTTGGYIGSTQFYTQKTFAVPDGAEYLAVTARTNITSIRNNAKFEFLFEEE